MHNTVPPSGPPTPTADVDPPPAVSQDGTDQHPWVVEIERLRAELHDAQVKIANLEVGLGSNREIGAAIGIVMATYRVTQDQAFQMMCKLSQHDNRKLRDVAAEVIYTGVLAGQPRT